MCDNDECKFNSYGICLFVILNLNPDKVKPCEKE